MIQKIKQYFVSWDASRYIKAVFAIAMVAGYFSTYEPMYLFGAVFFGGQVLFNIGCPGGACATNNTSDKTKETDKEVMTFDKYEPNKNK